MRTAAPARTASAASRAHAAAATPATRASSRSYATSILITLYYYNSRPVAAKFLLVCVGVRLVELNCFHALYFGGLVVIGSEPQRCLR